MLLTDVYGGNHIWCMMVVDNYQGELAYRSQLMTYNFAAFQDFIYTQIIAYKG